MAPAAIPILDTDYLSHIEPAKHCILLSSIKINLYVGPQKSAHVNNLTEMYSHACNAVVTSKIKLK